MTKALGEWRVRLDKYRATWSYGYTNDVGGGFGSSYCGPQSIALARATQSIPPGTPYRLIVNGKDRGVFVRGQETTR